jgi:hypothetical protein
MAIAFALSKFELTSEVLVAAGAVIVAEGQALVRVIGATAAGVMPSTASTATEIFCGFAVAGTSAAPFPEPYTNKVETFVVPASGIMTLQFTPVGGQVIVFDNTLNTSPSFTTSNNKITVTSGFGDSVTITYKYALTVIQRIALFGNVQPGGYAGSTVNQVGTVTKGLVYTSEFDVSVNWAAATSIKLAPNGQITDQSGSGAVIPAYVVSLPTVDYPYLGLKISAI